MAGIESGNYEQMRIKADELRELGKSMNFDAGVIYTEMNQMFEVWQGQQYNVLANNLITIKPTFEEMVKLVKVDMPDAIQTVAENYCAIETASRQAINTLNVAEIPDVRPVEAVLKFLYDKVPTYQERIIGAADRILDNLTEYQTILYSIDWKADSEEADMPKFLDIKNKVVEHVLAFKMTFNKFVTELTERIINTEQKNTMA